jgi:hypothetical protein
MIIFICLLDVSSKRTIWGCVSVMGAVFLNLRASTALATFYLAKKVPLDGRDWVVVDITEGAEHFSILEKVRIGLRANKVICGDK